MNRFTYRITWVILLVFSGGWAAYGSQLKPQWRNYGVNEGLPSSQVYQIIQTKNGYIWFGTDRGLVRYNGYEFKTYTTRDGLSSNVIFHLDEGPNETIYCYGKDRKIHLVKEHEVKPFEFNDIVTDKTHFMANVIQLNANKKGLQIDLIGGMSETKTQLIFDHEGLVSDESDYGLYVNQDEFSLSIYGRYRYEIDTLHIFGTTIPLFKKLEAFTKFVTAVQFKNLIYFSIGASLYCYDLKKPKEYEHLKDFEADILDMKHDYKGNIYLGLRYHGLIQLKEGDINKSRTLIADKNISGVLIDNEEGIWAGSLFDGLYYITNEDVNELTMDDIGQPAGIEEFQHEIYVCTQNLDVYEIKSDQINKLNIKVADKNAFEYSADNKLTFLGTFSKTGKVIDMQKEEAINYGSVHSFFYQKDSLYKFLNGGVKITSTGNGYHYYEFNEEVNCGAFDYSGKIIFGTDNGVKHANFANSVFTHKGYSLESEFYHFYTLKSADYDANCSFLRRKIQDIQNFGDSLLVFASAENGLMIRQKNQPDLILNESKGLISNTIEFVYYKDDYLVAMSKKGMSVISRNQGIQNYTTRNGLLSNEVSDAVIRNDSIWVVSKKGVSVFPLNQNRLFKMPIYLTSLKVNNINRPINEDYQLSHTDQSIDISFEALSYSQDGKIQYKYQLKGADNQWNFTMDRTVRYRNLPAGDYSFWLAAKYPDGNWSAPDKFFSISKSLAIWQTWYFQLLMVLLVLGIFVWIAYLRIKNIRQKEQDKLQVLNLERKTLQAQMNPHFIFNSLTSLQNLILKNDAELANEYLGKFARLTRIALLQSTENWVKLQDEVNLLEHYIQLEQIRFPNLFNYQINLNSHTTDIMVPPYLIQPFVENAILHGLSKRSKDGVLEISIEEMENDRLLFTVLDNGMGRLNQIENKTKRKSLGIRLIKERLKILLREEAVEIIDLTNDSGDSIGTKVKIIVPRKPHIE